MAYELISITPGWMGGLSCLRDTRVTVAAVLGQLAAGRTFEQILNDYPYRPPGMMLLVDASLALATAG